MRQMTKEQYIEWKRTRHSDPALWHYDDCRNADAIIRRTTLDNFKRYLDTSRIEPQKLRALIYHHVEMHFGSAEVDDLMMELRFYPDWM